MSALIPHHFHVENLRQYPAFIDSDIFNKVNVIDW